MNGFRDIPIGALEMEALLISSVSHPAGYKKLK